MHNSLIIEHLKKENSKPKVLEFNIVEAIALQHKMKKRLIIRGINEGSLNINGKIIRDTDFLVNSDDKINFLGNKLLIPKRENKEINFFDQVFEFLLTKKFDINEIDNLSLSQKYKLAAYYLEYFSLNIFLESTLSESIHYQSIYLTLKEFYKRYVVKENFKKLPNDKQLIDNLILEREVIYDRLRKVINNLKSQLYDSEYSALFRECRDIFSGEIFDFLVSPLTEESVDIMKLIHKIVNGFKQIEKEQDATQKIKKCIEIKSEYDEILKNSFLGTDKLSRGIREIILYFKQRSNENAGVNKVGNAEIHIIGENRTYNFNNPNLLVHAYIINTGKGIAKNVTIFNSTEKNITISKTVLSEIVIQNSSRYKVKFPIIISTDYFKETQKLSLKFSLSWYNENDVFHESVDLGFDINRQQDNLPWEYIKEKSPYDLGKIDNPTKLFGRDKLINDFKFNIDRSSSVASYVIHGQKRVGKSSIVTTLQSFYLNDKNVHFIYTQVTDRKGNDALHTFNEIGKYLTKQLIFDFEKKNPDKNNTISLPSFNGSLSPLIDIVDEIHSLNPNVKIIFAIDEFDELNEEFFENSNIGSVFASNIGKGLSSKKFVGVILIGSENTERKTKQGMRLLNAIKFIPVDSFPRSEFDEYCKIIKTPTEGCMIFSPEVLETIFEYSNGNPFYTNLICEKIFTEAYDKRIQYIDNEFLTPILNDVQHSLSTKDFVHFWEDGAADDVFTNKKTFSRRCRILLGFAEASKDGIPTSWNNIRKKIPPQTNITITDNQYKETFDEFIHRKIFHLTDINTYELKPKIFYKWLIGDGNFQITSQLEDREGLVEYFKEDEKYKISDDQLSALNNLLHGDDINVRTLYLRDFFEQFENNKDRALIADLLKQVKVLKSSELISFLGVVNKNIWPEIQLSSDEYNYRKDAEVVTFDDSFLQNEPFFSKIIRPQLHLSPSRKLKSKSKLHIEDGTKHLIIYEPLIDCQYYYRNEISQLLKSINPTLVSTLKIHIISFVITKEAKEEIENLLQKSFKYEFQFHHIKQYERIEISPYINAGSINDPSLKCLTKIYGKIHETSSLVKIGEIIPYQSFPFLWCTITQFNSLFQSNYKYEMYIKRMDFTDELKDLCIRSESKKIELKATMSVPGRNWKKIQEISEILKLKTVSPEKLYSSQEEIKKLWKVDLNPEERKKAIQVVQFAFAKNLSAFANTIGGELYIGIDDDYTIIGINEGNSSEEELRRIFTDILKRYIGVEFVEYFTLNVMNLANQSTIIKIDIKECKTDVWLLRNESGESIKEGELIFIRTEFGTEKLFPKAYKDWRDQRNAKYTYV